MKKGTVAKSLTALTADKDRDATVVVFVRLFRIYGDSSNQSFRSIIQINQDVFVFGGVENLSA